MEYALILMELEKIRALLRALLAVFVIQAIGCIVLAGTVALRHALRELKDIFKQIEDGDT